jgi:1,2-dihydroxy-3-keto-5-methylthiopentene dioxygenase
MAALAAFDATGHWVDTWACPNQITAQLQPLGIDHGRWPLRDLGDGSLTAVQTAYAVELQALSQRLVVRSMDRVQLRPGHPGWPALRQQFLAEHTHGDAEIRFFLGGAGLFYIRRADGGAFGLLCEATDWVAIPAGARHWFDAGEQPDFDALRLFSTELGWQAQPVPDAPIGQWPLLDEFRTRLLSLSGFHEG